MRAVAWVFAAVLLAVAVGIRFSPKLEPPLTERSYGVAPMGFSLGFPTVLRGGTAGSSTASYAARADRGLLGVWVSITALNGGHLGGSGTTGSTLPPSTANAPACGAGFS